MADDDFDALLWLRSKQGQYAGYPPGSQDDIRHRYFKAAADELEELREALEGEWESAHSERCPHIANNCTSFGGQKTCEHPKPEVLRVRDVLGGSR